MASIAFASACLPGGADAMPRLAQEVQGPRRDGYADFPDHPFDRSFKEQVKQVHGFDFNRPPTEPLPEEVHDSSHRATRPAGVGGI
jgi:hypothetical protein